MALDKIGQTTMPAGAYLQGDAPRPDNEAARLKAVAQFEFIIDQDNAALRELCLLAKDIFDVSYAGVSLVLDEEVAVLTSEAGAARRVPKGDSISAWAIGGDQVLTSDDLAVGDRFHNVYAWAPDGSFYAAIPLATEDGLNVAAFCIGDGRARGFGEAEKIQLRRIGRLAMNELLRQRALLSLRDREIMLNQASRMAKIGWWRVDVRTGETAWSDQMADIMDHPHDAPPLTAEAFLQRIVPRDRERMAREITPMEALDADRPPVEILRPTGESRWIKIITETAKVDGVIHEIFGSVQDVTELQSTLAEVERLAFRDSLTGLPNRTLFNSQLQAAIESAGRNGTSVGLIMIDLDHFKDVNDTLGHDAGDALLVSVAGLLTRSYRSTDTVARLGGDEFAIILPDLMGREDMVRPTEMLMELLRHPVEHGGQVFTISASVGGAVYPSDDDDAGKLLKNADIALYQAKAGGRNKLVTYEPVMREAAMHRVETLREVRQGITDGAFVLYYQPVVSLAPETVVGFEALMRWNHPTRGVLTPDAFMVGFEDPELAIQLGDVTLDGAMKQMRAWLEQGVEFGRVAINISAAQFRNAELAAQVEAKLKYWGVPADRLTIEVTENVYMGWGADVVGDTVRRLHDAGVLIALDDFGTGYASLTNLKQFPIDRLKIDKSFVQNTADKAIVQAVITLGASLGMKVVAEGVEEPDQLDFLARSGCDQVQGYHFARPMRGTEVIGFLAGFGAARPGKVA